MEESVLWSDLVASLLSSAVPERMSAAAYDRLAAAGLLDPFTVINGRKYERAVAEVLKERSRSGGRYRFPSSRAHQIAGSWSVAYGPPATGLLPYLQDRKSEQHLRDRIARVFPGLGLKQASLFLTRTGHATDLVALDTHVLHYLRIRGYPCGNVPPRNPRGYLELEAVFKDLTRKWGRPAGVTEFAVWLTMSELHRMRTRDA